MGAWIDGLAEELGQEPLSQREVARLLDVAREVAHRVERKLTPVSAFLIGAAVGRSEAGGASRSEALAEVLAAVEAALPEPRPETRPEG